MTTPDHGHAPLQGPVTRRLALRALGALGTAGALAACSRGLAATSTTEGSSANPNATPQPNLDPFADATLTALALSAGTLNPTFSAASTAYVVNVGNAVATMAVTPTATASASGAVVQVNGVVVASGSASAAVALVVGANQITVLVTAAEGNTTTYTLTVNRAAATCTLIPSETQGPYPLPSILTDTTMIRSNITEGKTGVPLTMVLSFVNVNQGCAPLVGARIYIWMCDKDGQYSGYTSPQNGNHAGETFLRGVQVTDASGQVTFQTIYPGWYAGRITHVHFQIFLATNPGTTASATSQIAFPQTVTQTVYASPLYAARGQNTSVTSFAADNVFSDGVTFQLATLTGSVAAGYTATLTVGVAG